MSKINHGSIIFANIPEVEHNPHQTHGSHYYIVLSNPKACAFSPVVQAVPFSSNINRKLPVQIEVSAPCFPRKSFALAEQLTLLPKNLLEQGRYCGTLDAVQMKRLQDAIKIQLSLD
jgi:mRNA-degrading endonuclease toxin of MazEF toxin-antitoxin module